MIPINELLMFSLASLIMVLSPGPNMIYLISRSLSQGKQAGIISLFGVICGFLFHILMVSFGLTAIFFAVPYAFVIVKFLGVGYLLYLAYNTVKSGGTKIFDADRSLKKDKPIKLFNIGLLTNVLNPKMALFYLSFFPQFIKPEYGSVLGQSFQLGIIQVMISFSINFLIVISAAKMADWFTKNPLWVRVQKWFMASVLTGLAVKIAFTKAK
ncbi:threonine/homoserine/homoserine lactone efflux protein [Aquimarina sp. MAR_2010_214]|uniref:LysE family translocator n=1 Tax=Aquimarina sp. MAR_2010_214 TaxID=1250026 RepID=UPI000C7060D4|nr:LysE family translocator [Aquimarina sp. MAR_2010_214]PKV49568.1 threonine/homoserine/homoserine lactone efflux protein [Aquimarina sp. MAR_2010_214]